MAGKVLRMAALDHLDLPELTYNDIMVDLPPNARKLYDAFENNLTVELNSGNVTAVNAAVAVMKGQQIANGGSYLDDDGSGNARISTHLHDAKTEAVLDLVEELSGQPFLMRLSLAVGLLVVNLMLLLMIGTPVKHQFFWLTQCRRVTVLTYKVLGMLSSGTR